MTITNYDTSKIPIIVLVDGNGNVSRLGLTADSIVGFYASDGTAVGRKLKTLGALELTVRSAIVTTSESVTLTDSVLLIDSSTASASVTIVLPTLSRADGVGRLLIFKDVSGGASSRNIILDPGTGITIDGNSTYTISQAYGAVGVMWTGTTWAKVFVPDTTGGGVSSGGGDPNAVYVVNSSTGSLPNALVIVGGTGVDETVGGGNLTLSIDNDVVATVSGSTFTGAVKFNAGASGSLTQLTDGSSFFIAGSNVTITTNSNGSVTVAAPLAGRTWIDGVDRLRTTASVAIDSQGRYANQVASDVFFYVSGSTDLDTSNGKNALFGGDLKVSGSLRVGSGTVKITSNDVQFETTGVRIDRSGNNLRFFDLNNTSGWTLTQLAQSGTAAGGSTTFVPLLTDAETVAIDGFQAIGGTYYNPADYSGSTVIFEALLEVTTASVVADLRLYNVTDASFICSMISSSSIPEYKTVSANMSASAKIYELQLKQASGSAATAATCKMARLRVL
jgi:hypothetical protein